MTKQKRRRSNTMFLLKWISLHLTIANERHYFAERKSIITAKLRTFQSKLASNRQPALAGKAFLAANEHKQ